MSKKMQDLLLGYYWEKVESFLNKDCTRNLLLKTLISDKYVGHELRVVVDDYNNLSIKGISKVDDEEDPNFKKILSIGFDFFLELDIEDYEEVINDGDMEDLIFELQSYPEFRKVGSKSSFIDLLCINRNVVEFVIVNGFSSIYEKAYLRKANDYIEDYVESLLFKTMDNLREILKREF